MAAISVTNVAVLNNPAPFSARFHIEVALNCLSPLSSDLEWRLIYIGSSEDEAYDQVLDTVLLGPLRPGSLRFLLDSPAPNPFLIPTEELLGITAILLTCSFRDQEFVKVGFYVNNEYVEEKLIECPPEVPDTTKIQRCVLTEKPRVTRFLIDWREEVAELSAADTEDDLEEGSGVAVLPIKTPYII